MTLLRKLFASVTGLFFLCVCTHAQQIQNIHADFNGEKVILSYDLTSQYADDKFQVSVYSSVDNFQSPLSLLVGATGDNVSQGKSNKITWDAKSSLPANFNDDIIFKVKAKVVVALHHASRLDVKPLDFNSFKRGSNLNLEWNGGKLNEPISVELYKENQLVEKLSETKNNNLYSWSIPKKAKPGKDYSIRISKTESTDVNSMSQTFEIKPKLPLIVKLIPIAVIGGVVAIISGSKEKDEGPDLPGPVTPGGG